jgi:hypothetical protein
MSRGYTPFRVLEFGNPGNLSRGLPVRPRFGPFAFDAGDDAARILFSLRKDQRRNVWAKPHVGAPAERVRDPARRVIIDGPSRYLGWV